MKSPLKPFSFPRSGRNSPNRLVLAAMTNKQSHADGTASDDEINWLAARAAGGFGIVTTCAAHVSLDGQGWDGELGVFDDALIPGLTRVASGIREHGALALALAQIFHGGVRSPSRLTGQQPWSASEFTFDNKGFERPRAATLDDIEGVIVAFGAAARRCAEAGFDGVEIHGAHGYLISQFLGTITNTRDDAWGGPLENRARLLRRIVAATRAATPEGFLIGVRLSPEIAEQGIDLDDALTVSRWLREDDIDFFHLSNWDSFRPPAKHPEAEVPLTTWFREALGPDLPLIATGGVWTPQQAEELMGHGADFVGLARAAIGNASWPKCAQRDGWQPVRPPYSPEHLKKAALGDAMIDYMRNWPGFVTDGKAAD